MCHIFLKHTKKEIVQPKTKMSIVQLFPCKFGNQMTVGHVYYRVNSHNNFC